MLTRRLMVMGFMAAPVAARAAMPEMIVYRDPECGCCSGWIEHMRAAGFAATVRIEANMAPVKARFGVPDGLVSCHTAVIGGYVIEGHVPAEMVRRLLTERPSLAGIAAPGMPVGAPGMNIPGQAAQAFQIIAFGRDGTQSIFSDYPRGWRG